jgi:hypothetical protein
MAPADAIRGADAKRNRLRGGRIGGMHQRERPLAADIVTGAGKRCEADAMIDRLLRPGPAAAERHHRHAEPPHIDAGDDARLGGIDRQDYRRCRQMGSGALQ